MNTSEGEHFDTYPFITKEASRTTFTGQLIMKHLAHVHTQSGSRVSVTQTYIVWARDASDTTDLEQLSRLLFWIMHWKKINTMMQKKGFFVPNSRLFLLRSCFHITNLSYRNMLCLLAEPLLLYYIYPIILLLKEACILI